MWLITNFQSSLYRYPSSTFEYCHIAYLFLFAPVIGKDGVSQAQAPADCSDLVLELSHLIEKMLTTILSTNAFFSTS